MKLLRLLIALALMLAMVSFARAQDAAPEATPEAVVTSDEAPAEVTESSPVETPVTVVNNGFSFEQVMVTLFAFILTIFAGIRMFVFPILKANTELAKAAGELVPPSAFTALIGITEGLQRWAATLTPTFYADDEALNKIRGELTEMQEVLHPATANTTDVASAIAAAVENAVG